MVLRDDFHLRLKLIPVVTSFKKKIDENAVNVKYFAIGCQRESAVVIVATHKQHFSLGLKKCQQVNGSNRKIFGVPSIPVSEITKNGSSTLFFIPIKKLNKNSRVKINKMIVRRCCEYSSQSIFLAAFLLTLFTLVHFLHSQRRRKALNSTVRRRRKKSPFLSILQKRPRTEYNKLFMFHQHRAIFEWSFWFYACLLRKRK